MDVLNTLQHIHSHFVNWQMQQRTSGRIVFWVKEVLAEYIKGDWRVPIRLVEERTGILVFTKKIRMQHICLSILWTFRLAFCMFLKRVVLAEKRHWVFAF